MAAAWALFATAAVWFISSLTGGSARASAACDPITFNLVGRPPPFVRSEFALATQAIHERSGLVFREASDGMSAKLSIWWTVPDGGSRPSRLVPHPGTSRRLGFGVGAWRRWPERRELLEAAVEMDGSVAWPLGLDRGDGLAAAFVHELGHVVGLAHNTDPASYMFPSASPRTPVWTASDEAELARLGRLSGCR